MVGLQECMHTEKCMVSKFMVLVLFKLATLHALPLPPALLLLHT